MGIFDPASDKSKKPTGWKLGKGVENVGNPTPLGYRPTPNTYEEMFRSRLLAERSRLEFHYGGTDSPIIFLPFYENPIITETQTANYAEYNPISRAGSMYAYLGAKSRKFKVDFYYTLPHLAFHDMGVNKFLRIFYDTSKDARKDKFLPVGRFFSKGGATKSLSLAHERLYKYLRDLQDPYTQVAGYSSGAGKDRIIKALEDSGKLLPGGGAAKYKPEFTGYNSYGPNQAGGDSSTNQSRVDAYKEYLKYLVSPSQKTEAIDTLLFFMGVIRTSVTNNTDDPMLPPPIVRITHGTLYQSIPTICRKYNISFEDESGYDLDTLTPRRIKISMSLDEVRVGDFDKYEAATFAKRDNLAGWEKVINAPYTTDPLAPEGFWKK